MVEIRNKNWYRVGNEVW